MKLFLKMISDLNIFNVIARIRVYGYRTFCFQTNKFQNLLLNSCYFRLLFNILFWNSEWFIYFTFLECSWNLLKCFFLYGILTALKFWQFFLYLIIDFTNKFIDFNLQIENTNLENTNRYHYDSWNLLRFTSIFRFVTQILFFI